MKIYPCQDTIDAVVSGRIVESDVIRFVYSSAFFTMNRIATQFGDYARNAISQGLTCAARIYIYEAYARIKEYESSPLYIAGKTDGIRRRIERIEGKLSK